MKKKATKRRARQAAKPKRKKSRAELERELKALRKKLAKKIKRRKPKAPSRRLKPTKPKTKAKPKPKTARKRLAKAKPKKKRPYRAPKRVVGRPVDDGRRPSRVRVTSQGRHLKELLGIGQALARIAKSFGLSAHVTWFVYADQTRAVDVLVSGFEPGPLVAQLDALLIDWSPFEKDLSHPRDRAKMIFTWDRSKDPPYLKDEKTTSLHYRRGENFGELLIAARVHLERADVNGWVLENFRLQLRRRPNVPKVSEPKKKYSKPYPKELL